MKKSFLALSALALASCSNADSRPEICDYSAGELETLLECYYSRARSALDEYGDSLGGDFDENSTFLERIDHYNNSASDISASACKLSDIHMENVQDLQKRLSDGSLGEEAGSAARFLETMRRQAISSTDACVN